MITKNEIKDILKSAEVVDANHYMRNMSVRRKKTLSKLWLLASQGIPTVSLAIKQDVAMMVINILLHELALKDGEIAHDPSRILERALERARRAGAGARLKPSTWIVRVSDNQRRWWWLHPETVTIHATNGRFELAPTDSQSIHEYPSDKLRTQRQGGACGVEAVGGTPENSPARAGEDTTHP